MQKIGSEREENAVIYRGLAPPRAKNCVNTSVSASNSGQKHRYLQCFVPSTFSWNCKKPCKYQQFLRSTRQKCCNLCLAFKNTGICGVLCILGPKSIGIYSIFCVFCMAPAKDVKTTFEKRKIVRKNVSKRRFFPILGTLKNRGGAGLCSWRRLWATRIPSKKLSPHPPEGFLVFFRGPASEGRRLGARLTLEL